MSHPSDGLPRPVPTLPDSVMEMFSLKGKVSIVTGASGGIGFAVAEGFAEAGSGVALLYNSASGMDERAKALGDKYGVKCIAYKCAVTQLKAVETTVDQIVKDFGRVDVFVANAGGLGGGDILDLTEEDWRACMAINFDSVFYGAKAVGPYFKKQGSGSFIATTSISAHIVNNPINQAAYNSAKAGVLHFCKSLSRDWRLFARVNTISPGFFDTKMGAAEAVLPVLYQNAILGRQGDVKELKGAFLYFASNASTYTTGADLLVDGGYTVC